VVEVIEQGRSTLVFTNTRWQTEAWYQAILKLRPDWAGLIALHHGSLDPEVRTWVEDGLRDGRLKCVVCTSSLDLGVDFAPVDQVVQVGSPKGIARLLQRAGRSGHQPGLPSRLICVPTNALELIEFSAARDAIARKAIEGRVPPAAPLDVLAQHAVTLALGGGFTRQEFLDEIRSARTYAHTAESDVDWVLDFVTRGGPALRAYPEYRRVDLVNGTYLVSDPEIARRHRMSLGTIVSDTQMVVQYMSGGRLGTVEESFLARLNPGDTFVFAGRALQLVRIRDMRAYVRKAPKADGPIPRWEGGRMPLSSELAAALRRRLEEASAGRFDGPEMERVRGTLEIQGRWSRLPAANELLIERTKTREGHHLFVYPLEGRLVHEGLAALCAYRLSRLQPISFSIAVNDFGFELLSAEPAPLERALEVGLFAVEHLGRDVLASLNSVEMARRQFREVARVAGLVFQGFPGAGKSVKQLQATSGLVFDVFQNYDPLNPLLKQARSEVLDRQLEQSRLADTLDRIAGSKVLLVETERPTPFAFPLLVDRLREKLSSEKLSDRVRKMQVALEDVADRPPAEARGKTRRKPARDGE
jgi:ATP-dependent Lhr-like helicase